MQVLKFGGTSVGSPENIRKTIEIVTATSKKGAVAVVVSAFTGVTDQLISLAQAAASGDKNYLKEFKQLEKRHLDAAKELSLNPTKTLSQVKSELKNLEDTLHGVFLVREVSLKTTDFIMSFGERLSAFIISQSIENAEFLDARKVIVTDNHFGSARVNFEKTNQNIAKYFAKHSKLQIITGFIGSTEKH